MKDSYSKEFQVDKNSNVVFEAILAVANWWATNAKTDKNEGDVFEVTFGDSSKKIKSID